MKKGKSLMELAQKLEHIRDNAKDFLVPTAKLDMNADANLVFTNGVTHEFIPTDYAHAQVATYAGVPKNYYDKLRMEKPELLSQNVKHGFAKNDETLNKGRSESRMLRTYEGKLRGFLSSSYRRLDSIDLAETVLPLLDDKQLLVESSEITDTRMYIKAVSPKITAEITKGDVVQYGIVISNSDVGAGSVRVEPLIYRLVCQNGMIANTAIRKFHVGKNMATDDITQLLSQETLDLSDAAFWAQIRDVVLASMNPENFERECNRLREASNIPITNFDIPEVVELSMRAVGVSGEKVKNSMISYLANGASGAGMTKWGLANAYTFAAHQDFVDSYDQSIELERAGSKIIDLDRKQWRRIAEDSPQAQA